MRFQVALCYAVAMNCAPSEDDALISSATLSRAVQLLLKLATTRLPTRSVGLIADELCPDTAQLFIVLQTHLHMLDDGRVRQTKHLSCLDHRRSRLRWLVPSAKGEGKGEVNSDTTHSSPSQLCASVPASHWPHTITICAHLSVLEPIGFGQRKIG